MARTRAVFGLVATCAALFVARLALVLQLPDIDCDAYGHFSAAKALTKAPLDLDVHWVWLPGYHYLEAAWIALGAGFLAVRIISCALASVAPLVVWAWLRPIDERRPDARPIAIESGLLVAIAPLMNVMGLSAQAEVLFTTTLLGCALALHRRSSALAAVALSIASMLRYEAWGAVAACGIAVAAQQIERVRGRPLRGQQLGVVVPAAPAAVIAAWIVVRRLHDGAWLTFLTETRNFAGGLRTTTEPNAWLEAIRMPLLVPSIVFGPALLFAAFAFHRGSAARVSASPGWLVPIGVGGFLAASYVGRGALAGERYFTSLTPFLCVAMVIGGRRVAALVGPQLRSLVRAALFVMLGATTTLLVVRWLHAATASSDQLRADQARVESE